MESFVRHTGLAVPMMRINIDTDQIVPGRELIRGREDGYAIITRSRLTTTGSGQAAGSSVGTDHSAGAPVRSETK